MADLELSQAARAAVEVAPAVERAAEAAGFLALPREILGGVADRLHVRREKNWATMATDAVASLRAEGISPHAVRDRTLRAIYEDGALEDDPDMRELWTCLLAAALGGDEIPPAYPAILGELEAIEAKFLYAVLVSTDRHLPQPGLSLDRMPEVQPLLSHLDWRHLDNLERLRVITYDYSGPVNVKLPHRPSDRQLDVRVSLTPLGRALVEACSRPDS